MKKFIFIDAIVLFITRNKEFPMFKVNKRELAVLEALLEVYEKGETHPEYANLCHYLTPYWFELKYPRKLKDGLREKINNSLKYGYLCSNFGVFIENLSDNVYGVDFALRRIWLRKLISYNAGVK